MCDKKSTTKTNKHPNMNHNLQNFSISQVTHMLENHLHQLTDTELRICARITPKTSFMLRHLVPPRQHAIMLAHSYGVAWFTIFGDAHHSFREETIESLTRYPEEWLAVSQNGFEGIFRKLSHQLGFRLETFEIQCLLKRISPGGRQALIHYITSFI